MPAFYTKTISSILEPVAQQVSLLVVLHEEAESGVIIPNLSSPIGVVKAAVKNLAEIGSQTYKLSKDEVLKRDMPPALKRVEDASKDLEQAAVLLDDNKSSLDARKKLIDGSRGILQGTSTVLVVYDQSEVRKIIATCNNVKEQLNQVENIKSMEQLALFIKNLTPDLTMMTKLVMGRSEELIVKSHADILVQAIDQIKNGIPLLLSALKTLIVNNDNPSVHNQITLQECGMNRNYSVLKLLDHIQEIIRILLMTGDSVECVWWENEQLDIMRLAKVKIDSRSGLVDKWINDSGAEPQLNENSLQEVATKGVLENFDTIATNCSNQDTKSELNSTLESMKNDYSNIKGISEKGEDSISENSRFRRQFKVNFDRANKLSDEAVAKTGAESGQKIARTIEGKIAQAQMWLARPDGPEKQMGVLACHALANDARHSKEVLQKQNSSNTELIDSLDQLARNIEQNTQKLDDVSAQGKAGSSDGCRITQDLTNDLGKLQLQMSAAIVDRVASNFVDTKAALRELTEAAMEPVASPEKIARYNEAAKIFIKQTEDIHTTANLVTQSVSDAKHIARLKSLNDELKTLTPQVISAGKIVLMNGGEKSAQQVKDHFTNMRTEWENKVERLTTEVDQLTDTEAFIKAQESAIEAESDKMESSIRDVSTSGIVESTASIARRATRAAQKAEVELSQIEDPSFVENLENSVSQLRSTITPMALSAKNLMGNIRDETAVGNWRSKNDELRSAVRSVKLAVSSSNASSVADSLQSVSLSTTDSKSDNEADDHFNYPEAQPNQPILAAAHILHTEAKQWSSKDNEIVAAAKRMAQLMAQLSQLVRGENSSKKDLIDVAKSIAQASEEVTQCAKRLGAVCTDMRIRNNLLQICERLPTIGTQLRILSTVKATMLGSQEDAEEISDVLTYVTQDESELNCGSDEDQEATEMLVGNARNLMQNVIETVHAAEAASIKVRVDSGYRIRWTKKTPWYQSKV